MKRAHRVIVHACSLLAGRSGAPIIGLAVIWMAATPRAAWCQWNGTNPVWTNSTVGIGISTPLRNLHISGIGWPELLIEAQQFPAGSLGRMWGVAVNASDGSLGLRATNSDISWSLGVMTFKPTGNVGIGTSNPQWLLSVNGTIGAKDVIVTNTGWSDYVFRPGYQLRPLSEVSAYIQKYRHLPDIPTEAEVKEKGVSVGEMQAKLLAKVEELTLHLIEQEKENKDLRERVAQLENRIAANSGIPSNR